VTLKEKKRDPQIRVFRERYRGLPAAKMARHLVVSEAAAPWSLALQALEPGAATEAEAAQLGELRAGLEAPRLLDQLAPFIEELATARSLLSSHPGFSRDFSRLQLELFGPVPAPFAGAALLVLLEDDADRRVDEEMERLARSVCDDPDGILAAYRRVIDDSIRAASESPRHCAYLYGRSGVSSEAYLGRSGVIVCLQRKGGGFRVSTCYRSEQGRLDRERSLETARTFRKKTHLTDWKLHTAEAWGELR